jgi:hypothetical protein
MSDERTLSLPQSRQPISYDYTNIIPIHEDTALSSGLLCQKEGLGRLFYKINTSSLCAYNVE